MSVAAASFRRRLGVFSGLALLLGTLGLVPAGNAEASKVVYDHIPSTGLSEGQLGEQFSGIGGVAVNSTGAGAGAEPGDIYVADSANNRIQQFHAKADGDGHRFVRAFGLNVGGAGVNVCTVAASCQAGTASGMAGALNDPLINPNGITPPLGLVIDQASGNIYVTDLGNNRVDAFSSNGIFEGAFGWKVNAGTPEEKLQFCTFATGCQAGSVGGGAGQFSESSANSGIAAMGYPAVAPDVAPHLAPNAGHVLVADSGNNRIDEFSVTLNGSEEVTDAAFERGIGWNVRSGGGGAEELQVCTTLTGCKVGSTGANPGQFTSGGASRVAVDTTGSTYAINEPISSKCKAPGALCRVQKFNLAATSVEDFAPGELRFANNQTSAFEAAREIAVDPTTNDVYVARPNPSPPEYGVLRFGSSGNLVENIPTGIGVTNNPRVFGLALDFLSAGKPLYLSGSDVSGHEPRVSILIEPPTEGPKVSTGGSGEGSNFSLRELEGTVNPDEFKVLECRFEYGTTTAYGESTPCVPDAAALGEGATDEAVAAETEPLEPNTTYHYRLVAENGGPISRGEDATFTTGAAPSGGCENEARRSEQGVGVLLLPDCMAVELVSPPQKGSQQAKQPNVSVDGERVNFLSVAALGETPSNTSLAGSRFVATRGDAGWTTAPTAPPPTIAHQWESVQFSSFTPDFSSWLEIDATGAQYQLGISQAFQGGLGGLFSPLSPVLVPVTESGNSVVDQSQFEGASADHSHLYFQPGRGGGGGTFRTSYFANDPAPALHAGPVDFNVYVARLDSGGPTLELLARDRRGKVWGGECGARLGGIGSTISGLGARNGIRNQGAVSSNGSRAYFSARASQPPSGACDGANKLRILERLETASGPWVGELFSSECNRLAPEEPCSSVNGDDLYQGASADGTKVYFTTNRQLANTDLDGTAAECSIDAAVAGCDLYLYDSERPAGHRLVQVSAGEELGAGVHEKGKGAKVYNSIAAISGDGSHVYFAAQGVLTEHPNPEGKKAGEYPASTPKLYLWDEEAEATSFVGPLSSGDKEGLWGNEGTWHNNAYPAPVLGPDGKGGGAGDVLVFESKAELTANDGDGEHLDVFRYDAKAEPPTLECVSCAPGGTDSAPFDVAKQGFGAVASAPGTDFAEEGRWVSEDGNTISFTTPEGLIPGDVIGAKDYYLWRDENLSRIPGGVYVSGEHENGPFLSPQGSEVAFQTTARLLPQDIDTAPDIYVARTGGGFPNPPAAEPCQPDESLPGKQCQEEQRAPSVPNAASATFSGSGNPPPKPGCGKGKVRRNGRCVSRKLKGRHGKKHHGHRRARHANTNRGAGK
jgi:hypothetical protein